MGKKWNICGNYGKYYENHGKICGKYVENNKNICGKYVEMMENNRKI